MLLAGFAATAALLAMPALANASVYCVNTAPTGCDVTETPDAVGLQTALDAAVGTPIDDTVRVGAGTYSSATGFAYNGFSGSGTLLLDGAGQTQTILNMPDSVSPVTLLNLTGTTGLGGATVSNLTLRLPNPSTSVSYRGLNSAGAPTNIDHITVDQAAPGPINGFGVLIAAGGTVTNTTISLPSGGAAKQITGLQAYASTNVTDSQITADAGITFGPDPDAPLAVDRTRIHANGLALDLQNGAATVTNSALDSDHAVISVGNPNGVTTAATTSLTLDGATLAGTGASSQTGVKVIADDSNPGIDDHNSADIRNSILDNSLDTPIFRAADNGDTASVTTSYTDHDPAGDFSSNDYLGSNLGVGQIASSPTDVKHFPVMFGANYHLLDSSPLIDIGDPVAPPGGLLDIDGDPRAVVAIASCTPRRDIGADEFVPAPAVTPLDCTTPPSTPSTPNALDTSAPDTSVSGKAKVRTRKKKALVTFTFGAAEAGSSFACSLDGGPFSPCTSPFSAKLRLGAHTLTVRATDAAGNTDATPASFTTRVKRKR